MKDKIIKILRKEADDLDEYADQILQEFLKLLPEKYSHLEADVKGGYAETYISGYNKYRDELINNLNK